MITMNEKVQVFLNDVFAANELNRLPENYGGGRIFAEPLTGVSRGDDPIFHKYKEVVAPEHLTPAEMWVQSGLPDGRDLPPRLRILSIVFPYVDRIREEGKKAEDYPADIYRIGRNFADDFMSDVLDKTVVFFQDQGFQSLAGVRSKIFTILSRQEPPWFYSVWSERHMAFAAGLGTFSLHEGFISEKGCNIRVASVVTDAPLEVTLRKSDDPYANCLFHAKEECVKCAERCPYGAITKDGHDKLKCREFLRTMQKEAQERLAGILKPIRRVADGKENILYATGCAFCQFGVPCTSKNPMAKVQEKEAET
ncbi:MAG: hypothetical protein GY866_22520 [Proteobacteria bacterium]|nr:hypothetical protein [Pseudomonadota bacterium]